MLQDARIRSLALAFSSRRRQAAGMALPREPLRAVPLVAAAYCVLSHKALGSATLSCCPFGKASCRAAFSTGISGAGGFRGADSPRAWSVARGGFLVDLFDSTFGFPGEGPEGDSGSRSLRGPMFSSLTIELTFPSGHGGKMRWKSPSAIWTRISVSILASWCTWRVVWLPSI